MRQIKVVLIGGGTGLSVMARVLREFPIDITAIVTVADNGGSTGKIRDEMDIPAPGDIRNVIAALSDSESVLSQLFQYRFEENQISGHSLGNLLIAGMTNITNDFGHAIKALSKILNIKGRSHSIYKYKCAIKCCYGRWRNCFWRNKYLKNIKKLIIYFRT